MNTRKEYFVFVTHPKGENEVASKEDGSAKNRPKENKMAINGSFLNCCCILTYDPAGLSK